jgi:hypothetical protein
MCLVSSGSSLPWIVGSDNKGTANARRFHARLVVCNSRNWRRSHPGPFTSPCGHLHPDPILKMPAPPCGPDCAADCETPFTWHNNGLIRPWRMPACDPCRGRGTRSTVTPSSMPMSVQCLSMGHTGQFRRLRMTGALRLCASSCRLRYHHGARLRKGPLRKASCLPQRVQRSQAPPRDVRAHIVPELSDASRAREHHSDALRRATVCGDGCRPPSSHARVQPPCRNVPTLNSRPHGRVPRAASVPRFAIRPILTGRHLRQGILRNGPDRAALKASSSTSPLHSTGRHRDQDASAVRCSTGA